MSNAHHNPQNGNDPCAHVVHVLLCYHQGGEDSEFIRKAIESLVKKLKDRRMELDSLISAVTSGGKQPSGCVTIHRSLDGRLQVAGRKGVPHVVYARIWRWPNVNKNELQKLAICSTPSEHPDVICINPFHYDRIVSSGLNNIEMSSLRMDPLRRVGGEDFPTAYDLPTNPRTNFFPVVEPNQNLFQQTSCYSPLKGGTSNNNNNGRNMADDVNSCDTSRAGTVDKPPFLMFGPNQQPSCVVSHLPSGNTISSQQFAEHDTTSQRQQSNQTINSADSSQHHEYVDETALGSSIYDVDGMPGYNSLCENAALNYCDTNHNSGNAFSAGVFPTSNNNSAYAPISTRNNFETNNPNNAATVSNSLPGEFAPNPYCMQRYNNLRYNLDHVQIPYADPPEHWCTALYYELDTQVGEAFKSPREHSEITIDGGMDPSGTRSGRFCLGALSNVHRTQMSEKARIHIGKGIKLHTTKDGSVYLKCLSQKGVFVRSYFLDFEHGLIYGSTVHKFCTGAEKKLFDLRWAFAEMCEQRESAQMAVVAQAYAVAGIVPRVAPSLIERAGIGVDDLRRVCCTIAVSFVKGWGSGYNRSSIKETPCWVEIHLHRPLQLLNLLLQKTE